MQLSETVEWALHACVNLAFIPPGKKIPAKLLAEYHDLKPAYLAKMMQRLAEAGIVDSVEGRSGGYFLAQPPEAITVLAIIDAVESERGFFRCTNIRTQGPCAAPKTAYVKPCGIASVMAKADQAWRDTLSHHTLADLCAGVSAEAPKAVFINTEIWARERKAIR